MLKLGRVICPRVLVAGETGRLRVEVQNACSEPIHGCNIVVSRSSQEDFPVNPLEWANRDHGKPRDEKYWLYYYGIADLTPLGAVKRAILLDTFPRAKESICEIHVGASVQQEFTGWKSRKILIKPRGSASPEEQPGNIPEGYVLTELFPKSIGSYVRQELHPLLPPPVPGLIMSSVPGYLSSAVGRYGSGRLMVHISEYDSHQHAGERFEMIRKEWWSEHRYPEGYKEPLINSHIGTMLKGGNGVAYGWQSGRHIFLLHFMGVTGEVPAEIFRDLPF